jgi:acyl-CoA synthetase (AMP-forming)/AMP-acid ligase II
MSDPIERADLRFRSIPEMVQINALRFGEREAIIEDGRRLTYRILAEEMVQAAQAMLSIGIAPGDRVAIWAPNSVQWVIAALGVLASGGVLLPVNTRFHGAEAAYVIERSEARALLTVGDFLGLDFVDMLRQASPGIAALKKVVLLDDAPASGAISWAEFVAGATVSAADALCAIGSVGGDHPSDILFTSGTTGAPKGVMSTHARTLRTFGAFNEGYGVRSSDRMAIVNPFFHAFGLKAGWILCLLAGATAYPLPTLQPAQLADLISEEQISILPGPPTLFTSLLDLASGRDFSSLRLVYVGATTIPPALVRRLARDLDVERVCTGYGLTEATAVVSTSTPDDDIERVAHWCGRPLRGTEVRIVSADSMPLPPGHQGEVQVRGFNVMDGYWEDAAATALAIDGAGWLRTGDLGLMDEEGYLQIVDRIKDIYIVGGFNVSSVEVENVLAEHAAVNQAAVVGAPDERLGEVGIAFVELVPGSNVEGNELIQWAAKRLANYKVPRRVFVVDELPRNATGKVMKVELPR